MINSIFSFIEVAGPVKQGAKPHINKKVSDTVSDWTSLIAVWVSHGY